MKKQTNLPTAGRKLSLNKKTISNLTVKEMSKHVGGSQPIYGCGNHSYYNCGGTRNGNSCPNHNTCYNCWGLLIYNTIKIKPKWKSNQTCPAFMRENSAFQNEQFLISTRQKWIVWSERQDGGVPKVILVIVLKIVPKTKTLVRVITLVIPVKILKTKT